MPASGLVAQLDDSHGNHCQRVDGDIAFAWDSGSPDPRIGAGDFRGSWRGFILVRSPGKHRLQVFAQGKVHIRIDGNEVLSGEASPPKWIAGADTLLRAGFRELEVEFSKTESSARLSLFWSGPNFGLEPIGPDLLFHESDEATSAGFARGEQLVEAFRCTACHEIPTAAESLPGPSLENLAGNIDPRWVAGWLSDDSTLGEPVAEQRRMPHFGLSRAEGHAIAAYLTADQGGTRQAQGTRQAPKKKASSKGRRSAAGDAEKGEQLFVSFGCLACHSWQEQGNFTLFGGSDLSEVASKRPADFFDRWLTDPAQINRHHRMPVFDLSEKETADLATFLCQQQGKVGDADASSQAVEADASLRARGRQLVLQHRCAACHAIDESIAAEQQALSRPLGPQTEWSDSCVVSSTSGSHQSGADQPVYNVSDVDQQAIEQYLRRVVAVQHAETSVVDGGDLLERSNCLACHPRGLGKGITDTAIPLAERYAEFVEHVAALVPPSLNSIGDKLHDEALREAINRTGKRRRPWLDVRMPRYPFSSQQIQQLAEYFIEKDRIPKLDLEPVKPLSEAALATVGPRLVTSDGFGCISCHAIGGVEPAEAPINARGPDLTEVGSRMRREWFVRWVADPLRIVPRVEMPAITVPATGVLEGDLERQIDAVWQVLNLDGFRPPKPDPFRVVRRLGATDSAEPAVVLTDVLRMDEQQWIKPLLIGLPNRHNILFDLQDARLDGWWLGNAAQQHVAGKTWYWEASGKNLVDAEPSAPEITLVEAGHASASSLAPQYVGQFRTELDQWRHEEGGLVVDHRLHFDRGTETAEAGGPFTVQVQQTFAPLPSTGGSSNASTDSRSGWLRTIRLAGLPSDVQVKLQTLSRTDGSLPLRVTHDGARLEREGDTAVRIELLDDAGARFDSSGAVTATPNDAGAATLTLRYTISLMPDRFPSLSAPLLQQRKPEQLLIAPGFTATQLTLPVEMLPTGFAWQADGAMITTSLEGRVWRSIDSDGDGLVDMAMPISDELATPFGVAAQADYLDVINKYGLLRLWDDDGDGFAERTQTVASGWGHTADYHDWAIGLPATEDGGYWVTLPCQQDERTDAAANLRGTVIKLVPREPTPADPHRFSIEPFTAGHRFPVGIAVNEAGDAFVPDNQGNYNPFNELNHLIKGKRYGFINANERRPGFAPPLTPPAINIPHPWTRSVNGICVLHTPSKLERSTFGPFEGHLVGCEYDTQRLIRMSLEKIGDTYQGAAYPLTFEKPAEGPPLLGPISCDVSPAGDLYIGNLRESGWGGGQNVGNVVKMEMIPDALPAGVAEVTARSNGFRITFTKEVSAKAAEDPANYNVSSYTRVSTPQYGGDDQQRREEKIRSLRYDPAARAVTVELDGLREGFVYEFFLENLTGDSQQTFFPAEAFYTLRQIPPAKP